MTPTIGQRIRLIEMQNDPDPIPPDTTGTVTHVSVFRDWAQVSVKWDIDRSLSLVLPDDKIEIIKE